MAEFNEADIEAAKRRVREMRSRASRFTAEEPARQSRSVHNENNSRRNNSDNAADEASPQPAESPEHKNTEEIKENDEAVQDKSFVIILALILILSKEGADNKLILALLYLLL